MNYQMYKINITHYYESSRYTKLIYTICLKTKIKAIYINDTIKKKVFNLNINLLIMIKNVI